MWMDTASDKASRERDHFNQDLYARNRRYIRGLFKLIEWVKPRLHRSRLNISRSNSDFCCPTIQRSWCCLWVPYANLASYKKDKYKISEKKVAVSKLCLHNFENPYVADDQFRQALDNGRQRKLTQNPSLKGAGCSSYWTTPLLAPILPWIKVFLEFNVEKLRNCWMRPAIRDTDGDGYREKMERKSRLNCSPLLVYQKCP